MEKSKKREISLKRAEELKEFVRDYIEVRKEIPKGMEMQEQFDETKKRILKVFNATEEDWNDWNCRINTGLKMSKYYQKYYS